MRSKSGSVGPSVTAILAFGGLWFVVDGPALADPWGFGASFGAGYFSHYAPTEGYSHYQVRSVTPEVTFLGGPPSWDIRFAARSRFEFYEGTGIDSITSTDDHRAERASLSMVHEWSTIDRLTADASYSRSHDLLDADEATVVIAGNSTRLRGHGAIETYGLEAEGGGHFTDYESYASSLVGSATGRIAMFKSRIQALRFGLTEDHYWTGFDHVMGKHTVFAAFRRRVSPTWTVELEGGAVRRDIDIQGVSTLPMGGLRVATTHDEEIPYELAAAVRFEGDSLASAEARFVRRVGGAGQMWLRASSLTDVDAVVDPHPLRTRTLALGVQDTVWTRNIVAAEAGYAWSEGLFTQEAHRQGFRANASWTLRLQPWLATRVGLSYLNQPADPGGRFDAFRRVRSDVELVAVSP
jgi:hypothetical protein